MFPKKAQADYIWEPGTISMRDVFSRALGRLGKLLCPSTVKMSGDEWRGRKSQLKTETHVEK